MSKPQKLSNILDEIILEVQRELDEETTSGDIAGYETPNAFGGDDSKSKKKTKDVATQVGYEIVKESRKPVKRTNRWLELKNDESMHANKKLSIGLRELRNQLHEVERFLGWYNKIKNINELDSDMYWKRTNNNIRKIKERIINIAHTLKEIEQ